MTNSPLVGQITFAKAGRRCYPPAVWSPDRKKWNVRPNWFEMRFAMKLTFIVFLLLIGAIVVACKRQDDKPALLGGQSLTNRPIDVNLSLQNKLRQELGLRLVNGAWILYRDIGDQEEWKIRNDGFLAKMVFKGSNGRVLADEDYYYSGKEFYDSEGHGWERITVHYDYESKEVYLAYTGTNKITEANLFKYFKTIAGASSDVVGAMAVVRKVTIGWPDPPK